MQGSATENMQMKVKNNLASFSAIIEDDAKMLTYPMLFGKKACLADHLADQQRIISGHV